MPNLILKSARLAYPDMSSDRDDYAVLQDGKIIGRIFQEALAGSKQRWIWSFKRASGKGYEMGQTESREEAMKAFRRAWDGRA
jgi:hypothetical protein